jgi:cellulose synthase/poly-beta-1,6-N-acetylglucosamine synthase-like glycosyltransferase
MFLEAILLYLALITLALLVVLGVEAGFGNRSIGFLKEMVPSENTPSPRVSVLIPARNEVRNIQEALTSVLSQDYPNLEVIVMDDRSSDGTGGILSQMESRHPRLKVFRLSELPAGWIGKNHALSYGAQRAEGELLLFTDADVVMQSSTVRKAVAYLIENRLDHLTLAPDVKTPGILLQIMVGVFTVFFAFFVKPWKVKDPKSSRFVGIGAFNLVRKEVYLAVGTHRAIAMRPDDDLKLGKLIKKNGYRQELLFGKETLQVEWYSSVRELSKGLMKNMFAGVDYRISAVLAGTLVLLLWGVWPFAAVFLTDGVTRIVNLVIVLLILGMCQQSSKLTNLKPWFGLGFPIGALFFVYIQWKAMLTALLTNGISWRDTHYSLDELKANKV